MPSVEPPVWVLVIVEELILAGRFALGDTPVSIGRWAGR